MNYTEAYKTLRNYGVKLNIIRKALDDAVDTGPTGVRVEGKTVMVSFTENDGFTFKDQS